MPRKRDARLEGRILDAAYGLWVKGGEEALTMRAVARAAKTTTPTVYERFRDKDELLEVMRQHARGKLVEALLPAATAAETCRRFLEFAAKHPNEYRLVTADWAVGLSRKEEKPSYELIKKRLVQDLGGEPEEHTLLALALGELLHGTATMLMVDGVQERVAVDLRHACMAACVALVKQVPSQAWR
jgi:AcrR family transcriptional regulator